VAERIVALIERLRASKLSHGDMKATNILITADQPTFIDLDAMHKHPNAAAASRALQRDLRRFMQNWESSPAVEHLFKALLETLARPAHATQSPHEASEF
jgi:serine/threonine-protein kinase RIO1